MGLAAVVVVLAVVLLRLVVDLWPLAGHAMARAALDSDNVDLLNQAAVIEALLALPLFAALIAAAVLVIIWTYRAYRNLLAIPGSDLPLRPGWAIGGWFVPLANLVIPYRMMAAVVRSSLNSASGRALVVSWWLVWLTGEAADRIVARIDVRAYAATPDVLSGPQDYQAYIDYYGDALVRNIMPMVLTAAAGVLLSVIIVRVSRAQHRLLAAGSAASVPGAVLVQPDPGPASLPG